MRGVDKADGEEWGGLCDGPLFGQRTVAQAAAPERLAVTVVVGHNRVARTIASLHETHRAERSADADSTYTRGCDFSAHKVTMQMQQNLSLLHACRHVLLSYTSVHTRTQYTYTRVQT